MLGFWLLPELLKADTKRLTEFFHLVTSIMGPTLCRELLFKTRKGGAIIHESDQTGNHLTGRRAGGAHRRCF
jgi:hypothetical protein